jgi:hypothetical protein
MLSRVRRFKLKQALAYNELRTFLRPRSRHHQHVPADCRRLQFLLRTLTVLCILGAASRDVAARRGHTGYTCWREP